MNQADLPENAAPKECPPCKPGFFPRLRGELHRVIGRGYRGAFLLSFMAASLFLSSAYIYVQLAEVNKRLYEDFKVYVLPDAGLSKAEQAAQLEAVSNTPGVAFCRFVSREELLDFLRMRDPETAKAAAAFGENPVPEFYEVRPSRAVLASVAAWIQSSFRDGKIPGVWDVTFKQGEADAVVYSSFCLKFIRLMMAQAALALALFWLFAEFSGQRRHGGLASAGWLLSGVTGAAFAVFIGWAMVYPVRYLLGWWVTPQWQWHALALLCGAFIGRALCKWSA
ncbi:MAG: hypothetical protein GX410_00265 [Elusimicrobia bacterium]|nr:hypothetical protein [Elusimicrobiota bacterium]